MRMRVATHDLVSVGGGGGRDVKSKATVRGGGGKKSHKKLTGAARRTSLKTSPGRVPVRSSSSFLFVCFLFSGGACWEGACLSINMQKNNRDGFFSFLLVPESISYIPI